MTNLSDVSKESKQKISGGGWNFETDPVENFAWFENVFTPEECKKIIEIGNNLEEIQALTFQSRNQNTDSGNIFTGRKSFISWIFPNPDTSWIFARLTNVVTNLNSKYFGFNLNSFSEGLQFTRYYAPDGHYCAHIDRSKDFVIRKLSISIQLNDSSEFDGGDLIFYFSKNPMKVDMKQGKLTSFPSYVLHEVTPVTRGVRYSLVAWISGPPFK